MMPTQTNATLNGTRTATATQLLQWLLHTIEFRTARPTDSLESMVPEPPATDEHDALGRFLADQQPNTYETLLIALLIAPQVNDAYLQAMHLPYNPARLRTYTATDAVQATIGTALFLLAGQSPDMRLRVMRYFDTDHWLYRRSIMETGPVAPGAGELDRVISLSTGWRDLFLRNLHVPPRFSDKFPAHRIETSLDWDDLILNDSTRDRLDEIRHWLSHQDELIRDRNIGRHVRRGYRCLFHGPSGTGKTLAATLLGKHLNRPVYRVDLSAVISKYIGETSKNLSSLFDTAEDKDWILFFDEGDALFGRRVNTSQADNPNLHFANQDIAFLLQRIEYFGGLVIVSTNFKKNFDEAFARRFNQMIMFGPPEADKQIEFWTRYKPESVDYAPDVNLQTLTAQHQLTGAVIINVLQRATVLTLAEGKTELSTALLQRCIRDENYK